jgi:hypothetical protein
MMKIIITLIVPLLLITVIGLAQPTIATDSILQTSTCVGGNVIVPFMVSGGNFNFGNVFTAQLSNAFGQFTNPVNIGSVFYWSSGLILATIPANTNFGFLYKIRVVGSNPSVTGTPCPNTLIITQVAQLNQIIANPGDTACIGDSITLTALNPAQSYLWSTGDTTASITVSTSGVYSVTTTDLFSCESTTSDTVYFQSCAGFEESNLENSFRVYPNWGNGVFTVDLKHASENTMIEIFNIVGRKVYDAILITEAKKIDLSKEPQGIYFIHLTQNKSFSTEKIIITY